MVNAREIVMQLGGDWYGSYGLVPGPGHSREDRSVNVTDGINGEIIAHSFTGEPWQAIKAVWRAQGLLPFRQGTEQCPPKGNDQRRRKARERLRQSKGELNRKAALDTAKASAIWRKSGGLENTIAETYLGNRGLKGPHPPSLRFIPALEHPYTGLTLPCLVAGIQGADGSVQAVQRTYLRMDGAGKAPISRPCLAKGPIRGGTVRLAAAGSVLGVCEGVETGLSAMRLFNTPVWCCLGGANIKNAPLPDVVRLVVIYADAGVARKAVCGRGGGAVRPPGPQSEIGLPGRAPRRF